MPALLAGGLGLMLDGVALILGWCWSVAVLYICMGYRQLVDKCRSLAGALVSGDLPRARKELAGCWIGTTSALTEADLVTAAIETILRSSLTRVFGVLFWFVLLGPFGAVLYFLSHLAQGRWEVESDFIAPVALVVHLLDWLPARVWASASPSSATSRLP